MILLICYLADTPGIYFRGQLLEHGQPEPRYLIDSWLWVQPLSLGQTEEPYKENIKNHY